jgi:hypothetical protein
MKKSNSTKATALLLAIFLSSVFSVGTVSSTEAWGLKSVYKGAKKGVKKVGSTVKKGAKKSVGIAKKAHIAPVKYGIKGAKGGYNGFLKVVKFFEAGNGTTTTSEKTINVNLQKQTPWKGFIPYVLSLNLRGNLKKVQSVSNYPSLHLLKRGYSSKDCNRPGAGVWLKPGNTLSPQNMRTLFGSKTPAFPVLMVACAEATRQTYNYIPIKVTYEKK